MLALGLFTFSWPSVYYASEVKQYGSDVLVSLILLSAAYLCIAPEVPRRNWLALLGAGTLGLWMSHPALFTTTAVIMVLAIANLLLRNRKNLCWLFSIGLCWMLNSLFVYLLSLRYSAASKMLNQYWQDYFMPWPPWSDLNWFWQGGRTVVEKMLRIPLLPGLAVLTIGVIFLFRRDWKKAAMMLLPILAALSASGLEKYPFYTRFLLFTLPMFCMFMAAGMQKLHELGRRCFSKAGLLFSTIVVGVIFFQPVAISIERFASPENRNDIKPLMDVLRSNLRPRDTLYVHCGTRNQFKYYAHFYGIHPERAVVGSRAKESPKKLRQDIMKLAGRRRLWILFASRPARNRLNHEEILLTYLRRRGVLQIKFSSSGANLYLFDLGRFGQRPGFLLNSNTRTASSTMPKAKTKMAMALKTR